MKAKLADIANAIDSFEGWMAFLDRETGEVIELRQDAMGIAEETEEGEEPELLGEVEEDELAAAMAIVASPERCLSLPDQFDFHEYAVIESFVDGLTNTRLRDDLSQRIRGAGAFRRFKDGIARAGIEDAWYAFRDKALKDLARAWCEENGIEFE